MIVVDTGVWIDHLIDRSPQQVRYLRALILDGLPRLVVGDLVLCAVPQGLASENEARRVEAALRRFDVQAMADPHVASASAADYRRLRSRGITPAKTIDMLIGTFCIEHGHALLHDDRDFDHLEQHLGLQVVRAQERMMPRSD